MVSVFNDTSFFLSYTTYFLVKISEFVFDLRSCLYWSWIFSRKNGQAEGITTEKIKINNNVLLYYLITYRPSLK